MIAKASSQSQLLPTVALDYISFFQTSRPVNIDSVLLSSGHPPAVLISARAGNLRRIEGDNHPREAGQSQRMRPFSRSSRAAHEASYRQFDLPHGPVHRFAGKVVPWRTWHPSVFRYKLVYKRQNYLSWLFRQCQTNTIRSITSANGKPGWLPSFSDNGCTGHTRQSINFVKNYCSIFQEHIHPRKSPASHAI